MECATECLKNDSVSTIIRRWRDFTLRRDKERTFFQKIVHDYLTSIVERNDSNDNNLSVANGKDMDFFRNLLLTDSDFSSMELIPRNDIHEGFFYRKYPLYPLYIPLSNSIYQHLKQKTLIFNSFHLSGVNEDTSWHSKIDGWKKKLFKFGFPILMIHNLVDYELEVIEPFFSYLQKGMKTIEGRCNIGKYSKIKEGNFILFNKSLFLQIKKIHHFDTFKEMLSSFDLNKVLPNACTIEEGVTIYRQFYDEEKETKNGVVAFELTFPVDFLPSIPFQPKSFVQNLFENVDKQLFCLLLGMKKTIGSIPYSLPPPLSKLFSSFLLPHHPKSKLTVGARALSKHTVRSSNNLWGTNKGNEGQRNESAMHALLKLIQNLAWMNMHTLPHHEIIFEIRCQDGYGARWSNDGNIFRGFLEPPMEFGHEKKWRH